MERATSYIYALDTKTEMNLNSHKLKKANILKAKIITINYFKSFSDINQLVIKHHHQASLNWVKSAIKLRLRVESVYKSSERSYSRAKGQGPRPGYAKALQPGLFSPFMKLMPRFSHDKQLTPKPSGVQITRLQCLYEDMKMLVTCTFFKQM